MKENELRDLVDYLVALPNEKEWVEFKVNNSKPDVIGERLSAIANSACLHDEPYGYLVYGVDDKTHEVIGTKFNVKSERHGNEDLEMWLLNRLNPRIDIEAAEFDYAPGKHISIFRIPAAVNRPVTFLNDAYVRVNTCTKKLSLYPEKEAKIWRNVPKVSFESGVAKSNVTSADVLSLLSTERYFDLLKLPYPTTRKAVLDKFASEKYIVQSGANWHITNLGAMLFAKNLSDFDGLNRKAIRVVTYKGKSKLDTLKDEFFMQGYAISIERAIHWIGSQLPTKELIGAALRENESAYPEKSIREIAENMVIHQDFDIQGFPTVEIFEDRVEFTNSGTPLIEVDRFIDEYQSRNDLLSDNLRRLGFCEEKGSGMDKAVMSNELFLLPALSIRVQENRTVVIMYARKSWADTNRLERLQACYQHACVKYVSNESMTNQSLRIRFNIEEQNASMVSRIIKEAIKEGLIKEEETGSNSRKFKKYIPYWA